MFWADIILLVFGAVFYSFGIVTIIVLIYKNRKTQKEIPVSDKNIKTINGNFRYVKTLRKNPDLTDEQNYEKMWDTLDVGMRYTDDRNEHVYEIIDKDFDNGTFTVKAITTFSYLELPDLVTIFEPKSEVEREEYIQDIKRRENAKTILKEFD